jgi:chromosome segregation ATPase
MTLPSDPAPDRERELRPVPPKHGPPSDAGSTDGVRSAASSSASAIPTRGAADVVRPLVDEIKAGLSVLAGGESDVQQREQLEARVRELETRAAELDERRRHLDELEGALNDRQREQDRQRAVLAETLKKLEDREAVDERGRVEVRRHLAEKLDLIRQRKNEFTEKVQVVRAELKRRQVALARDQRALSERAAAFEERRREIERRAADLERRTREVAARSEALERQRTELDASTAELEESRKTLAARETDLAERTEALERREQQLAAQQAELAESCRFASELQDRLTCEQAELGARARELAQQQARHAERRRQLEEREVALSKQAAAVESRRDQTAQKEAEIERRRLSVERIYQQAVETQQRAQQRQQELAALQQQLEVRETELRRDGLQTEIDREQVERSRATLRVEQEQLAELRTEIERELDRARAIAGKSGGPSRAFGPAAIRPARLWRRGLALSVVAGLAAALAWFVAQQPSYRARAEIRVASERGSPGWIAGEHAEWLASGELLEHWQGPPPAEAWTTAFASQRISIHPLPDRAAVRLMLDTADETIAETLLPAAAGAYVAYVEALPLERFRSTRLMEWVERKATLEHELASSRARRQELETELAAIPAAPARNAAQFGFQDALREFKQVVARLRGQREQLTSLQSQELSRGEVSPEAYRQALADDLIYQEDSQEFRSETQRYQTELVASMARVVDPLRELRQAVAALAATIIEQRDLRPPANIRTLLEQRLAEVNDLDRLLGEFAQSWDRRRETVGQLQPSEQVVELVTEHEQAADAARRLVEEARRVPREVSAQIDALSATGDGGTRELVVAAALRGDLNRVMERIDALAEAGAATDLSVNFRLDACDRQVRGLRVRLRDREGRIRELLQASADRAARVAQQEQERQLRERISALDQQRQALLDTLVAQLDRLSALDEQDRELRELSAELRAEGAASARLEERLGDLELARPVQQRDSVALADARYAQIAGVHRLRDASLAGAAAFVATGLLLWLLFVRGVAGRAGRGE